MHEPDDRCDGDRHERVANEFQERNDMTTQRNLTPAMRAPRLPFLIVIAATISACGGRGTAEGDGHAHGEEAAHAGGTTVTVTPAQFAAIDGALGRVERKDLSSTLQATGFLKVPPQNKADVTSIMGGTVREVLVQEGDEVRKGQPLAIISDPAIIQLQRDHLDAKARLAYAKAELDRQTELAAASVSAQKTLQQAAAEHASLLASVQATAEQLRLIHIDPDRLGADLLSSTTSIVSPIDGAVAHIDVNTGSRVNGDAILFRVVNNSKLHVDLFLYEQDIARAKTGQTIDLSLTNLPGRSYTAVIFAIGSAFESETKTIPVHAEITGDKEGLIDGMGVSARINTGTATTTAVLSEAIVNMEGRDYVFIRTEGATDHGQEHAGEDEHAHAEGEAHEPGHDADGTQAHAHAEDGTHPHDHAGPVHGAQAAAVDDLSFQRVEVKRGTTEGAFTAVAFLQTVPDHAEVVTGGAYYLLAMMNTSSGHQH